MTAGVEITPLDALVAAKIGAEGGKLTQAQLSSYQLARLKETISRVQSLSPFYRRRLADKKVASLTRLEDLAEYPFTTAADVTEHAIEMVCGSQSQINRVVTLATSGTTGNPKRVYFSKFDQQLTIDHFGCGMSTLVGPGDKTLILLPGERPGSVGDLLLKGLLAIGVVPVAYGLVQNPADAVRKMCQEQATSLVGIPVQVLAMARYWEKWGKSSWAPRCGLLSTDYVPAAVVNELRRIWNCEIYDHYGMTEMGLGGGMECSAHTGHHLREADLYFEIIDPDSTRVLPDGEYGEVVFTTLTRQGMPLIRYRTGDISRFIPELCPCGSILRCLERVRCRKDGRVSLGQAGMITMADFDEVLLPLPEVINFTATVFSGQPSKVKLVVEVLSQGRILDEAVVLQAVRQLPVIQQAEQERSIVLEAAIACDLSLPPGKRSINVVGPREDA